MYRIAMPFSLLLVLPLMTPAAAQERQFRSVGFTAIVAHPAVHKELKLNEDQTAAVRNATAEARKGTQANQKLDQKERRAKNRPITQKLRDTIAKALNDDQNKRLLQIELQYSSAWILRRKDVSESLELTREQRREIRDLAKKSNETSAKLRATRNDDNRRDIQKKITAVVAETRAAALKLLTEDQQKKWKEALGKPFELPRRGRGRKKKKRDKDK